MTDYPDEMLKDLSYRCLAEAQGDDEDARKLIDAALDAIHDYLWQHVMERVANDDGLRTAALDAGMAHARRETGIRGRQ